MKFTYTSGSRPLDGYTIKRGIGHGGFGEVYYAVSDGGKEVALKLVQRNLDVELRGVAQCMNLKHPNLVTLYDLRTNDVGEHFVVMEYVSGKCLAELLEEHPQGLPIESVNRWLQGISAGVGYLHDKGIVHRDLKPGNLFVEDGVVKVGDYGLSKFITASRRSGQTESVGTVHYMAPEISRGKYDREIDIYATGVIVYEMLTGDVPFDGESVGEILMKHLTAQPDVSKLPPPYDRLVACALAKDPAARFRTMEQLAGSLNGRLVEPAASVTLKETAAFASPAQNSPEPVPSVTARPHPVPNAQGPVDTAGDWFARTKAKVVAWYERPWTARDYVIAVLCLAAIAAAAPALTAGVMTFAPGAIVAVGIAVLVLKATKKSGGKGSAAVSLAPLVPQPVAVAPAAAPSVPAPLAPAPAATPVRVLQPYHAVAHRPELEPKPARTRLAEAISAMLLTAVLSVLGAVLVAGALRLNRIEECALLAATALAGCWGVLIPGKFWEGRRGDPVLRRLVMCGLGLGIGLWCGYLDGLLGVGWFTKETMPRALLDAPAWMPAALVNASYFGLVFLLPRWWVLADSRRGLRLNPWLVIVPCFWAYLAGHLWGTHWDDQPIYGLAVTGMVSVLVQLASPWDEPALRRRAA